MYCDLHQNYHWLYIYMYRNVMDIVELCRVWWWTYAGKKQKCRTKPIYMRVTWEYMRVTWEYSAWVQILCLFLTEQLVGRFILSSWTCVHGHFILSSWTNVHGSRNSRPGTHLAPICFVLFLQASYFFSPPKKQNSVYWGVSGRRNLFIPFCLMSSDAKKHITIISRRNVQNCV